MTEKSKKKNYYETLSLPSNASLFDIENAYQKLASEWHPDKHKTDRKSAEQKFNEICEAYDVLSDRNKRSHYDEMLQKQFGLTDAEKTFQDFYKQHGMKDQKQQEFFSKHYPNREKDYYSILEIRKDASMEEIKEAYRKMAMRYHPKNNPNNEEAHKKFIEINEAYKHLSDGQSRETYDNWVYGAIQPFRAHNIFEDFFENRLFDIPQEQQFFRPIINRNWTRKLDSLMNDDVWREGANGEMYKTSTVYRKDDKGESKKTITTKRQMNNGNIKETKTEEYCFPDGHKQITETVNNNGTISSNRYNLKPGEERPRQLTN